MNSVSDARQVESFDRPLRLLLMPRTAVCVRPLMVFVPIVESAWSKTCQVSTIPLCDSNVVISISLLIQLEVCEADVDPVALSCLDRLDQVHVVGIVAREEGRRHLSACCHDLRLSRQNAWKRRRRRKRVFNLATNYNPPVAPHAFCPEVDPFVDGALPWSEVLSQHLDTLCMKGDVERVNFFFNLRL